MNFDDSQELRLLRETVRKFVSAEVSRQQARQLDIDANFNRETFKNLCRLGVTGLTVPEEYGGSGVDIVAAIAVIEELTRRGTSLAGPYIHCAFYGAMNILENGNERQRKEMLPKFARGEMFFAYGLSEPDVGGDLASCKVTAILSDDQTQVKINGTKRWCSGVRFADYIYTLVRSGPAESRYKNLSLVLVPTDATGIEITDISHTSLRYTSTTDVIYEDVTVPVENIVGGIEMWNRGWQLLAGRSLDVERLEITAVAFGIAQAAVEDAWQYAQERVQFGRRICAHQAVRHELVDAKTKLEACRHMLYHAAWLASQDRDCSVASSMAKLFVGDTAVEIVLACQRVMGAYGLAHEYDMERYVRDILCIPIVGGSSNMQKNNIAGRLRLPEN